MLGIDLRCLYVPNVRYIFVDFIHMLWKYWSSVISTINSIYQVQLAVDKFTCLLGGLDEELYSPHSYIACIPLFYFAKKLIARLWLSPQPPARAQWIQSVNTILIGGKNTYYHRNSSKKFGNIWQCWLDTPGVPPTQLV